MNEPTLLTPQLYSGPSGYELSLEKEVRRLQAELEIARRESWDSSVIQPDGPIRDIGRMNLNETIQFSRQAICRYAFNPGTRRREITVKSKGQGEEFSFGHYIEGDHWGGMSRTWAIHIAEELLKITINHFAHVYAQERKNG